MNEGLRKQVSFLNSPMSLNAIAALFHSIQAVVVLGLVSWLNTQPNSRSGIFHLDRSISIWHKKTNISTPIENNNMPISNEYYIEVKRISSGELDVRYVIVAFFTLSAIFQAIGGYIFGGLWGCRLRFIEYSFSASIMVIAIGAESGIHDFYTLAMMFALMWVTMIMGLLADFISDITLSERTVEWEPVLQVLGPWSWLVPHISGWVTFLAAYGPIMDVFVQSSSQSDVAAPGFVHVIVYLQFVLFACFGFVQSYSLVKKTYIFLEYRGGGPKYTAVVRDDNAGVMFQLQPESNHSMATDLYTLSDLVEKAYITLSFVAKTILGWLILSPILVSAIK